MGTRGSLRAEKETPKEAIIRVKTSDEKGS